MSRHIYIIFIVAIISIVIGFPLEVRADNDRNFTVVIDAGHGGKDVGATENGVMEKNINLKVAKQLESLIKKKMKNTKVVMTRDDDSYLTLQQRAEKANKAQGDIFISIHTNSISKKSKSRKTIEGSSVYTLGLHKDENNLEVAMRENSVIELEQDYQQKYSGFDPQRDESYIIFEMAQKKNLSQSIKFAENIEKELIKAGRKERGVHQAGFWVLWATSMPSVLVELDFICNPQSAKYMASDKGSKELAEALFNAIKIYEESWNKSHKGGNVAETSVTPDESRGTEPVQSQGYIVISDVAKVKTRVRTDQPKTVNTGGARKRRSISSRQISLANNYEKDDLYYIIPPEYAFLESDYPGKDDLLSQIPQSSETTKSKDKKGKKKTEKKPKEKKPATPKKRDNAAYNAKINKLVTVYMIQIHESADLLNQGNSLFCGLSPISTYKENNQYKYFYGESTDKSELESVLTDVKKKIPDAFIVSSTKSIQSK